MTISVIQQSHCKTPLKLDVYHSVIYGVKMESKGMMLRDVHTYLALPIRGPKGINPT